MSTRRMRLTLAAAIVILAAVLRIWFASDSRDSLWGDEVQELGIIRTSDSVADLIHKVARDGHPPLHYLLMYPIRSWSDGAQRAVRTTLGVLAVVALIALAWRTLGATTGILSGLFMATGPFFIYYATEVRVYSLFLLLSILFGAAFLRFLHRPSWRTAAAWGVVTALLAYCHYYAFHMAFAAGIFGLFALQKRKHLVLLAGGVGALLYLPWLPILIGQVGDNLTTWHRPIQNPLLALDVFTVAFGRFGGWLVALCIWRSAVGLRRSRPSAQALSFYGLLTVALGGATLAWIAQLRQGPYVPRYLVGMAALAIPSVCLLLANAVEGRPDEVRFPLRPLRVAGNFGRAAGVALIITGLVLQWEHGGETWMRPAEYAQEIAAYVEREERPGDLVWFAFSLDGISVCHYYRGTSALILAPSRGRASYLDWADHHKGLRDDLMFESLSADMERHLASGGRVFLVSYAGYAQTVEGLAEQRNDTWPELFLEIFDRYSAALRRAYTHGRFVKRWATADSHHPKQVLVFER